MKKIVYIIIAALVCVSCEDFLDSENLVGKDSTNFPKTADDADQMINGIYSTLSSAISDVPSHYYFVSELASDDRFGGGGENDKVFQGVDKLMNVGPDWTQPFWETRYTGIFRANMALETLDNCDVDEATLNKYKGEAHFLRGFFYHELAEMFGPVPMRIVTTPENNPRADVDLVYGQIAYDLKNAIEKLPAVNYSTIVSGHATKWAAESLMARVFLFYTGFYNKTELPLGDGTGETVVGSVTKSEVIAWIDDCVANSGHGLLDDFRQLWAYSNEYTAKEYDFVSDLAAQGKYWVLDGSGNKEHVFTVKCSKMADWGTIIGYSNQFVLFFGLRSDNGGEDTFPFGVGWGAGGVSPQLWNDWSNDDPRKEASILDVNTDVKKYIWGADKQVEESGFWQKKLLAIRAHDADGNLKNSFSSLIWESDDNFQLRQLQDHIVVRFADVLLMQSELKENAEGINRVRTRAGLGNIAYSLDNLKKERRFELAFEGRRWADIRRWHIAEASLDKQKGTAIWVRGLPEIMKDFGGGYSKRYQETQGFFPVPVSQISISGGVLEQTPGWGNVSNEFQGW
ncbi:MAG: RagB/SusD family nutrient uptake outer membrane protein [Candidatus Symbiothrix sp.]|jgi:hypothetical protein|nr:RagB/SusD family nutrient uptake outer membrane protein [Candidatus Symbiothrix sp.]